MDLVLFAVVIVGFVVIWSNFTKLLGIERMKRPVREMAIMAAFAGAVLVMAGLVFIAQWLLSKGMALFQG